jgi:GAF domain-containing protein
MSELMETLESACTPPLTSESLPSAVAALAAMFNVKTTEVALLRRDEDNLVFVVPQRLSTLGTIPLSAATTSVAARTASTRRPELLNKFSSTRHASVFEGVKVGDSVVPIQKLISAPIIHNGSCIGVVQISRKGKTSAEAADFTSQDLETLTEAAQHLANVLLER